MTTKFAKAKDLKGFAVDTRQKVDRMLANADRIVDECQQMKVDYEAGKFQRRNR